MLLTGQSAPTVATRCPVSSSRGISSQLVRLLPPLGCPGQPLWVPPNEVQRWEQLGYCRAPIPAADLELSWQPAGPESGGLIPIELLLNPRLTPPHAVTLEWGDGRTETLPWPASADGNARLRHRYAGRSDYTVQVELSGNGITASLLLSLAGCPIWQPEPIPPPPTDGGGSRWFNGNGPPGTIAAAGPGDYYLDGISGAFYVLEN